MVVVTWPFTVQHGLRALASVGRTKTKRQLQTIVGPDRQHAPIFFPIVPPQREVPFSVSHCNPSLYADSCTLLLPPWSYFIVLSIESDRNELHKNNFLVFFIFIFFSSSTTAADECMRLAASHLFWFRWLKSFASVGRMIGCNDDDQLESQLDRSSIIYSVDSQ